MAGGTGLDSLVDALAQYRTHSDELKWVGTFRDYLGMVQKDPAIARLAHVRVNDMIRSAGVEMRNKVPHFKFFDVLHGIDRPLADVMEYLEAAAAGLDVRKRMLLLIGPPASGKSTLAILLKRGLELYSRTDAGAMYGLLGCPMHEEPLHLIPLESRGAVEASLKVTIEGDLCPLCQWRLDEEYHGDRLAFPVERVVMDEGRRLGIGTFTPGDPKSMDTSMLTGALDFAKITEFGSESDPRAFRFDGELNVANRGIMEAQEILKCVVPDTWIFTAAGMQQIGSLVQSPQPGKFAPWGGTIAAPDLSHQLATDIFFAGREAVRTVKTRRGFVLTGTKEHPIQVYAENDLTWRPLRDVQVGDRVPLVLGSELWPSEYGDVKGLSERRLDKAAAAFLGVLYARGELVGDELIAYMGDKFSNAVMRVFSARVDAPFVERATASGTAFVWKSAALLDWVRAVVGSREMLDYNKQLPKLIATAPRSVALAFLQGYFRGELDEGCQVRILHMAATMMPSRIIIMLLQPPPAFVFHQIFIRRPLFNQSHHPLPQSATISTPSIHIARPRPRAAALSPNLVASSWLLATSTYAAGTLTPPLLAVSPSRAPLSARLVDPGTMPALSHYPKARLHITAPSYTSIFALAQSHRN